MADCEVRSMGVNQLSWPRGLTDRGRRLCSCNILKRNNRKHSHHHVFPLNRDNQVSIKQNRLLHCSGHLPQYFTSDVLFALYMVRIPIHGQRHARYGHLVLFAV